MLISELEVKLKELREEHGDLPVFSHPVFEGIELLVEGVRENKHAYIKAFLTGNEGK